MNKTALAPETPATPERDAGSDPFSLSKGAEEEHRCEGQFASPPCFLHELDPTWLGYAGREEVLGWLNELLEAERAGARGINAFAAQIEDAPLHGLLRDVAKDEARFCAMLTRHIERLGGTPTQKTGAFHAKLAALNPSDDWQGLLDRGQGWVVRKLDAMLPRIGDEALHADLTEMRQAHLQNIERCNATRA